MTTWNKFKNFDIVKLEPYQEQELYTKVKNGDKKAVDFLITNNMHLAKSFAISYRHYGIPVEDLFQEAVIGMIKAIKTFDNTLGFKFGTYATPFMKEMVLNYITINYKIVKFATTKNKRKLFFKLRSLLSRKMSIKEIADFIGCSIDEVFETISHLYDIDAPTIYENTDGELLDWLISDIDIEEDYINSLFDFNDIENIDMLLNGLPERTKRIIQGHWLSENKMTLTEIGEKFGISYERVRQIEKDAFCKIRNKFKNPFVEYRI